MKTKSLKCIKSLLTNLLAKSCQRAPPIRCLVLYNRKSQFRRLQKPLLDTRPNYNIRTRHLNINLVIEPNLPIPPQWYLKSYNNKTRRHYSSIPGLYPPFNTWLTPILSIKLFTHRRITRSWITPRIIYKVPRPSKKTIIYPLPRP